MTRKRIQVAAKPPPPISGGTLHVTSNGLAVAADSDRDMVFLVDLNTKKITKIALEDGDEPGRIIEDGTPQSLIATYGRDTLEEVFLDVVRGRAQQAQGSAEPSAAAQRPVMRNAPDTSAAAPAAGNTHWCRASSTSLRGGKGGMRCFEMRRSRLRWYVPREAASGFNVTSSQ